MAPRHDPAQSPDAPPDRQVVQVTKSGPARWRALTPSGRGEHSFPPGTRLGCTACSRAGAVVRSAEPVCLHLRMSSLQLRWHADGIRVYVHPAPEATVKPSKLQHVCGHGREGCRQHACHTCTRSSMRILIFTRNVCALVSKPVCRAQTQSICNKRISMGIHTGCLMSGQPLRSQTRANLPTNFRTTTFTCGRLESYCTGRLKPCRCFSVLRLLPAWAALLASSIPPHALDLSKLNLRSLLAIHSIRALRHACKSLGLIVRHQMMMQEQGPQHMRLQLPASSWVQHVIRQSPLQAPAAAAAVR